MRKLVKIQIHVSDTREMLGLSTCLFDASLLANVFRQPPTINFPLNIYTPALASSSSPISFKSITIPWRWALFIATPQQIHLSDSSQRSCVAMSRSKSRTHGFFWTWSHPMTGHWNLDNLSTSLTPCLHWKLRGAMECL